MVKICKCSKWCNLATALGHKRTVELMFRNRINKKAGMSNDELNGVKCQL